MTAILSALGLGGLSLAMAFLPGLRGWVFDGLRFLADLIARHPWQAACLALAIWGTWEHFDAVHARKATVAWKARWDSHLAADQRSIAQAIDWRDKYQKTAADLTNQIGARRAENDRYSSDLAAALRVRGPGRAAAFCGPGSRAGLAAAASGPEAPGSPGDAPMAPVPDREPMAILPWRDLTAHAEKADLNRNEVLSWREWYAKQAELLKARKAELPAVEFGK